MSRLHALTACFEARRLAFDGFILILKNFIFKENQTLQAQAQGPVWGSERGLKGMESLLGRAWA